MKFMEELSFEADTIQYGLNCIQNSIISKISNSYPPVPTPAYKFNLNVGDFLVIMNV